MTQLFVAVLALSFLSIAPSSARGEEASGSPAAPKATETAQAVAGGGLDAVLAKKVTPIQGADRHCGNDKGGFAFNTAAKKIWQTGDGQDVGLELTVQSLVVGATVEASASLENLVQYSFSGTWSELTVKLSSAGPDAEDETFKLQCR